jgi:tetratricopeptide (TPR) repeat protein
MKRTVFLSAVIILFSSTILFSQTIEEYIAKGDSLYRAFNNEGALKVFLEADAKYPGNWEIQWRLSRTYTDIAEHMPSSTSEQEDKQLATYETAVEYADRAVESAPDKSVTYLRRAIANGRIALFKGVFSVGAVVDQVRDDCIKAIELDNGGNEVQGVAHYVLARTHDKISDKWSVARAALGLGWADYDSAMVHYAKAVELYPDFMMIYVEYAKAFMEEDEWESAKEMLEKAISCPIIDEDDEKNLVEAKNLLEEVKEEL